MFPQASFILFTFVFVFTSAVIDEELKISETKFPSDINNVESLHELVRIVNQHNMNVSVVVSEAAKYKNGNYRKIQALSLTFPVNNVVVKKSGLEEYHIRDLLRVAKEEELAVGATETKENNYGSHYTIYLSNYFQGLPESESLRVVTYFQKGGLPGFHFVEPSFSARYTFSARNKQGQFKTTKVLHGDLEVEVVESTDLERYELKIMKKVLAKAYLTHDEEFVPMVVNQELSNILSDYNWEVVGPVGENSYLDSSTWARFKILDKNYLVYAI